MTTRGIPLEFWQRHRLLPLEEGAERITVGFYEGPPRQALEDLRLALGKDVRPVRVGLEQLQEGLRRLMVEGEAMGREPVGDEAAGLQLESSSDLLADAADAPVIRLLNALLLKAMDSGASDLHFEPYADRTLVRMRIDGVLHEEREIPRARHPQIVARLKVMSRLDLAETRRPQDGRLRAHSGDRRLDVRVSVIPTLHGERVVLRLLEKDTRLYALDQLGLDSRDLAALEDLLACPYGLFLSTGPTGSGKTTSLYAMLGKLRSPHHNIITIEDPVEYEIPGVGQIQVNPKIGLTFASGLRSILRQDPDILMVGEIRDPDTADIAVHAALTGHLVLSTLHTNDAPTAATRLMDLGVPAYLLSSSLLGAMAQRLVRRLCDRCKRPYDPTAAELARLGFERLPPGARFHQPAGCEACLNTGYRGRTGIFEIMVMDEELRRLVARAADSRELGKAARRHGMRTLLEDAALKVARGLTSTEEALRASRL